MQTKFSTKVFPDGQNRIQAQLSTLTDCIVFSLSQLSEKKKLNLPQSLEYLDGLLDGSLSLALSHGDFSGKSGETLLIPAQTTWAKLGIKATRILLVGSGDGGNGLKSDLNDKSLQDYIKATRAALRVITSSQISSVLWLLDEDLRASSNSTGTDLVRMTIQLIEESRYRFGIRFPHFKTKPVENPVVLRNITFATNLKTDKVVKESIRIGGAIANGTSLAKDLGNLPPNMCTPTYLAKTAQKIGKNFGIKVEVLERKDIEALGMGAMIAVTQGAETPPKFIVMHYKGANLKEAPTVLVGKGITFDTGGISLKPGEGMDEMKYDMCGAASVLGTMHAVCEMKLNQNIIGVVPTCENMPSGKATRPGDIVVTMSGQTVEILNTDAEGRLILCDALTYVERFKPKAVIDIATLTGACVIALGSVHSGLFSKDLALSRRLQDAGSASLDTVWPMPLDDAYQEQLKSNFADIANIGGRPAGSVTAACFLARFTHAYSWAHLDIAGTAWKSGAAKGSTGRPVPLLTEFLIKG